MPISNLAPGFLTAVAQGRMKAAQQQKEIDARPSFWERVGERALGQVGGGLVDAGGALIKEYMPSAELRRRLAEEKHTMDVDVPMWTADEREKLLAEAAMERADARKGLLMDAKYKQAGGFSKALSDLTPPPEMMTAEETEFLKAAHQLPGSLQGEINPMGRLETTDPRAMLSYFTGGPAPMYMPGETKAEHRGGPPPRWMDRPEGAGRFEDPFRSNYAKARVEAQDTLGVRAQGMGLDVADIYLANQPGHRQLRELADEAPMEAESIPTRGMTPAQAKDMVTYLAGNDVDVEGRPEYAGLRTLASKAALKPEAVPAAEKPITVEGAVKKVEAAVGKAIEQPEGFKARAKRYARQMAKEQLAKESVAKAKADLAAKVKKKKDKLANIKTIGEIFKNAGDFKRGRVVTNMNNYKDAEDEIDVYLIGGSIGANTKKNTGTEKANLKWINELQGDMSGGGHEAIAALATKYYGGDIARLKKEGKTALGFIALRDNLKHEGFDIGEARVDRKGDSAKRVANWKLRRHEIDLLAKGKMNASQFDFNNKLDWLMIQSKMDTWTFSEKERIKRIWEERTGRTDAMGAPVRSFSPLNPATGKRTMKVFPGDYLTVPEGYQGTANDYLAQVVQDEIKSGATPAPDLNKSKRRVVTRVSDLKPKGAGNKLSMLQKHGDGIQIAVGNSNTTIGGALKILKSKFMREGSDARDAANKAVRWIWHRVGRQITQKASGK
jgi:hypothetical protein